MFRSPAGKSPLLQTPRLAGNSRKCKEPCRALRWKARPVCVPHRFPASRAVPLQREPLSARPLPYIVHPLGKPFPSSAAVSPFLRNPADASSHFPLRNGFIPFLDSHSCKCRLSPEIPGSAKSRATLCAGKRARYACLTAFQLPGLCPCSANHFLRGLCRTSCVHWESPSPALRPFRLFSGTSRVLLHTFGTAHKNAFGTGKLCPSQRRFCKGSFFPQFPFKAFRSRISKGSHAANGSCPDGSSGKLSGPPEMA